jgi:hypothetical protein
MSPNFGYVPTGAKTRVSVCHTPRQMVRVCEIHVFLPPVASCIKVADLVSPCARRTLISVSARQPRVSSVYCAQRRGNRRRIRIFSPFFLFVLPYCLGKRIDFCSVDFIVFFSTSNLPFSLSILGRCIATTDGSVSNSVKDVRLVHFRTRVSAERATLARSAPNRHAPSMPPRFPIHEMQWRNERHTFSQSCTPSAFSKCQVHGSINAMHLIDQFSSKFLLLYWL